MQSTKIFRNQRHLLFISHRYRTTFAYFFLTVVKCFQFFFFFIAPIAPHHVALDLHIFHRVNDASCSLCFIMLCIIIIFFSGTPRTRFTLETVTIMTVTGWELSFLAVADRATISAAVGVPAIADVGDAAKWAIPVDAVRPLDDRSIEYW